MSAITMGMSSTGTTRRSSAPGALHGTGEIPNKKAEFATFDQDPRQWHDFLKSRGADETARAQLFELAQTSWGIRYRYEEHAQDAQERVWWAELRCEERLGLPLRRCQLRVRGIMATPEEVV